MQCHRSAHLFRGLRTLLRIAASAAVLTASLSVITPAPAAAAGASITLTKSAPDSVLVGGDISYGLKAENTAAVGDKQYNLTFRDILPAGVKYVKTTAPSGLGDPVQIVEKDGLDQPTGRTILIWSNVADLPGQSDVTVSYTAKPNYAIDPDAPATRVFVVGDDVGDITTTATAYVSSDERAIPKFTGAGGWDPKTQITASADASVPPTKISALKIAKSEISPERELVRGIDARSTTYTLKVTNNSKADTTGVKVVDYLPDGLEFLGCKDVSTDCLAPDSVTTVQLSAGDPSGHPAGVYTKVTWTVGTLGFDDADRTSTIKYAAGIPLKENVMPADPGSFNSTNNLDNNTGTPTRETETARPYKNFVDAAGTYTGDVKEGTSNNVTAHDSYEVTAQDIALHKTVANADFSQGEDAVYTLAVRVSEYTDGSNIVLVDTLPDGMCPSDAAIGIYTTAAAAEVASNPPCTPLANDDSDKNLAIEKVDFQDNRFVITFNPIAVSAAEAKAEVTYKAKMRTDYRTPADGLTSAGDTYVNTVKLTGTTDPVSGNSVDSGTQDVLDDSGTTIASGSPIIDKRILKNTQGTSYSCDNDNDADWADDQSSTGDYSDPADIKPRDTPFMVGSRVCFWIRVEFPTNSSTRDPVIADYLPANLEYEDDSFHLVGGNQPGGLPDEAAVAADFADHGGDGIATFTPEDQTVGGHKYVDKGKVFAFKFSAIVVQPPLDFATGIDPDKVDILGNLVKMQWTDRTGRVTSARDQTNFLTTPPPPIDIEKLVAPGTSADFDPDELEPSLEINNATTVHYQIELRNDNVSLTNANNTMYSPDVWDVLPAGFDCSTVSVGSISDDGVCTDPSDSEHPNFVGNDNLSAIRWKLPASATLSANALEPLTLSYDVQPPIDLSVDGSHDNTAYVRSYDTHNNFDGVVSHYPNVNVDEGLDPTLEDVSSASSTATLVMPDVELTKSSTSTATANNRGAAAGGNRDQAVPGETVTYTIQAKVPAHASVYKGVLTDPTFADSSFELDFQSAAFKYSSDATVAATGPLPPVPGFAASATGGDIRLQFPDAYSNNTSTDQLFEVTVIAIVKPGYTGTASQTNTAHFSSQLGAIDTTPATEVTAATTVDIIQPNPAIAKASSTDNPIPGTSYTYTLTATNPGTVPSLYDTVVTDCVPAGITVSNFVASQGGPVAPAELIPTPAPGGSDCPAGASRITWNVGTIAADSTKTLKYDALISSVPAGLQSYENTARLTGSTLADGVNNPTAERVIGPLTAVKSVTVPGATVTKTIADNSLTIGEYAEYTVTATVPKDINFYDLALIDVLPATARLDLSTLETTSVTCAPSCTVTPTAGTPGTNLTPSGSTIGWSLGNLTASTQERTVTIKYRAKVADIVANTANADLRNNSAILKWNVTDKTDPTAVGATFDQQSAAAVVGFRIEEPKTTITKKVNSADSATPSPGDTFTYTVTVTNPGGTNVSDAHNVVVEDVVPAGVVIDAASVIASGGAYDGPTRTITWNVPLLTAATGADHSKTFSYLATLADSTTLTASPRVNTATVTGFDSVAGGVAAGGRDYTGPNATATVTPQFPHVTVTKSIDDTNDIAYVGDTKQFKLVVKNEGTATAYNIDVKDVLPQNWGVKLNTGTINGVVTAASEPTFVEADNPQTLLWTGLLPLSGSGLAPGASLTIRYQAIPATGALTTPGAGSANAHTNTAYITKAEDATGKPANLVNDYGHSQDTATARINEADLSIAKAAQGTPVAGEDFSWKITVSNAAGRDSAVGPITVTDTIPDQLTALVASTPAGSNWTCSLDINELSCSHPGPLAAGQSLPVITVTGHVPSDLDPTDAGAIKLDNTAEVAGKTYESKTDNNTDTEPATVTFAADLKVTKTLSGTMVAGQNANYSIMVSNLGPSTSRGPITVTDTLPAGVGFVGVTADEDYWDCVHSDADDTDDSDGTVVCTTTEDIAVGAAVPAIGVEISVPADRHAAVVNTAALTTITTPEPAGQVAVENNTSAPSVTPDRIADIYINKRVEGGTPFTAGANGTYTITVGNLAGYSTAEGVQFTDVLPDYLSYVGVTSTDDEWSCVEGDDDNTVTCSLDHAIDPGDESELELEVEVKSGHTGTIENAVDATTTTPETNSVNNHSAYDNDSTDNVNDLKIEKTVQSPVDKKVAAGTSVTYGLTITNQGPSDYAGPVVVTDTVPAGFTLADADPDWGCIPNDPDEGSPVVLTCTHIGALPMASPSVALWLEFDVPADAEVRDGVRNTANVAYSNDPHLDDNTSYADVDITNKTDVTVVKSVVGEATIRAGENATYSVVVSNDGPSDAHDVTVTDELPAGMTTSSADGGDDWDCSTTTTTYTCAIDTIATGVPAPTITVVATVGSGVPAMNSDDEATVLTNVATVSNTDTDGPHEDTDDATITVINEANLGLVKSHDADADADAAVAGSEFTFWIDVANHGPSDAQGPLTVEDTLPDGLTFVRGDSPWSCLPPGDSDPQTVTCTLQGYDSLIAGESAPRLVLTTMVGSDQAGETLENSATVSSDTPEPTVDPDPYPNTDTDEIEPVGEADISVTKSHTGPVEVGEQLTFTLTAHNAGPSEARDVTIDDELPAGLTFVKVEGGTGWTCETEAPSCTLETLAAGTADEPTDSTPITVTVSVTPEAYPHVTNVGKVSMDTTHTTDPNTDDESKTEDLVTVPPKVDLSIVKELQGGLKVGRTGTYTLKVGNAGPTADPGVITVTDVLPVGLSFASGTAAGWDCSAVLAVVTCTRAGAFAKDASETINVNVNVDAAAYPSVSNTAAVSSDAVDTDPANNTSTVPDSSVLPTVILKVDKTHTGTPIAGKSFDYTVKVHNDGPSAAQPPITITDTLPAGMTYRSVNDAWTCSPDKGNSQKIDCTLKSTNAVPAGADVTNLVMTVDIAADQAGKTLANTVVASSLVIDPSDPVGTDTDTVTPVGVADVSIKKSHTGKAKVGQNLVFTLTAHNAGPSQARGVVVTDMLPTGLKFVKATGAGWTCMAKLPTCTLNAPLAPGATAEPITVTVKVTATGKHEVTNVGKITMDLTDTTDPDPGNNAAKDTVDLPRPSGGGLMPDTGGAALWLLGLGMTALVAGGLLVARRRPRGKHTS